ncbi:glycosyltransferase [Paenibacillus sp. GCM10023252]|uniref:glycosyltransferase n=1 Tax=Paenibacillus sp. GCM10023252 TaxID=3252649 RepID=UPI00360DA459
MSNKLKIVFASHTYIGGPYVVGSHHLARELSKMGHEVLHISTPITPFHILKRKDSSTSKRLKLWREMSIENEDLINCVPLSLIPWRIAGEIFRKTKENHLLTTILLPSLKKILNKTFKGPVDVLLIDQPYFVGINKYINAKKIIYRATDLYPEMTGDKNVSIAEEEIIKIADGLVATSEPVREYIQSYDENLPSLLLENGVEFEHFNKPCEEPNEIKHLSHPRAVYLGAIDQRLDLNAIHQLAVSRPDLNIIIIGPATTENILQFKAETNVHFLGAISYSKIPSYLQFMDIALLPLSKHASNNGRSPMKLYEYAASGLPIVVRETPEILRRNESYIFTYKNSEDITSAVKMAEKNLSVLTRQSISNSAEEHSWKTKAMILMTFIENLKSKIRLKSG